MPRSKIYKDEEGSYLGVHETARGTYLAWFCEIAGEFDVGAILGQVGDVSDGHEEPPTKTNEWENWLASSLAKQQADYRDQTGYCFESARKAKQTLARINEQLLNGDRKPWPEWATQAKEAGWKPPKGWKP